MGVTDALEMMSRRVARVLCANTSLASFSTETLTASNQGAKAAALEKWRKRDHILKASNQYERVALVCNTKAVATAQQRFQLSSAPAQILGRCLTFASMMSSFLKGEERIIVDIQAKGELKRVYAEAMRAGEVRGFASPTTIHATSLPAALGDGAVCYVHRVMYHMKQPVTSIIQLQKGDITTDMQHFFTQSEQIKTALIIHTTVDHEGTVNFSGGLISQLLPDAPPEFLESWESRHASLHQLDLHALFQEHNFNSQTILKSFSQTLDVAQATRVPLDFFCRCNKENFKKLLVTLPQAEIQDMQLQNQRDLTCQFCNEMYVLDDKDFSDILTQMQANQATQISG
eukprot:c2256_g1_i1.p1 GENE.c2256_g1_i1~~c2256_g1_i1.p1  ORF type:complete len:344 (+),score=75.28 c2256_g1_i1:3-1034(+)